MIRTELTSQRPEGSLKILYSSQDVRREIRRVLAPGGRRVVAVAFVGAGADAYLPNPKGLELYCWPEPTATSADTLEHLIKKRGVRAHFVQRFHGKVYWSEQRGAVIASANLSTNALGSGGLKELGVSLPRGAVNIDRVLRDLDAVPVTTAALDKLRKLNRTVKRTSPTAVARQTFADWYLQARRPGWMLATMDGYVPPSERAKAVTLEDRGKKEPEYWLSCSRGDLAAEDWVLTVDYAKRRFRTVQWMYTHRIVRVDRGERAHEEGNSLQAVQTYPLRACPPVPFTIDAKLRRVLRGFDWDDGGIERPSAAFVRQVYEDYIAT